MLAIAKVKEIKRLLAEGNLSYRKIAKSLGVSRSTVSGIANGTRPDYEARRQARADGKRLEPLGPIARCPSCGGKVYMPCRLCRVRKMNSKEERQLRVLRRLAREHLVERLAAAIREQRQQSKGDDAAG